MTRADYSTVMFPFVGRATKIYELRGKFDKFCITLKAKYILG